MRFLRLAPLPVLVAAAFVACGGTTQTSTTSGTGASSSGSTSTSSSASGSSASSSGSAGPHGCKSSADCSGNPCAALTPGGYQVCITVPAEATSCTMGTMPPDACCTSADCTTKGNGGCYPAMSLQFCGGAQIPGNQCIVAGCTNDAECSGGATPSICAPAGAFNSANRECVTAFCKTDADCKAKAGGECLLVGNDPCCRFPSPDGLGCVYPGDCASDADCTMGDTCHLDTTTGVSGCISNTQGCPG